MNLSGMNWKRGLIALGIIFVGFGIGFAAGRNTYVAPSAVRQIRSDNSGYEFTNPLLLVDNSGETFSKFDPLKERVNEVITRAARTNKVETVGFYYRDLTNGEWTGINEDRQFSPGSMLKVATLIAYLKLAQNDPQILTEKVPYTSIKDPGQHYKPTHALESGMRTKRELLIQMIAESDNSAMDTLNEGYVDNILSVYKELGMPNPVIQPHDFLSPSMYSRILRTLYNSSYLSRPYSEEALRLLSHTAFDKGIVAGTGSTTVAHKFGENTLLENGTVVSKELHDCGIVYYPGNPYLLCIMTKGDNFEDLQSVIVEVSKVTYSYVERSRGSK